MIQTGAFGKMQHSVQEPNSGLSGTEDLEGGLVFYTEPPEHGSTDGSRGAFRPLPLVL